jgi:hypothetical protein
LSVDTISEILHIDPRSFYRYRKEFISRVENSDIIAKKTWGGRRNMLMSEEEEEIEFLSKF